MGNILEVEAAYNTLTKESELCLRIKFTNCEQISFS
jgi:hypothetical protein